MAEAANPKLAGSNIIDCIPQTGECPHHCSECFYNGGRFYRTLDEPLLPTLSEAAHRIVRVNSGNDSNNQRDQVIANTVIYPDKFYNTSVPALDFPGPVVLTVNGETLPDEFVKVPYPPINLMFVRVRASLWNPERVRSVLEYYTETRGVPVVATFMRYYSKDKILQQVQSKYVHKQHITNDYWCPRPSAIVEFMNRFEGTGLRMCGTPWSSRCVDCRNCEFLYHETRRLMHNMDRE